MNTSVIEKPSVRYRMLYKHYKVRRRKTPKFRNKKKKIKETKAHTSKRNAKEKKNTPILGVLNF